MDIDSAEIIIISLVEGAWITPSGTHFISKVIHYKEDVCYRCDCIGSYGYDWFRPVTKPSRFSIDEDNLYKHIAKEIFGKELFGTNEAWI